MRNNKKFVSGRILAVFLFGFTCAVSSAASLPCGKEGLRAFEARTDKPTVAWGETITVTARSCYEPPGYALWARVREAPAIVWPLFFDREKREWSYTFLVTQDVLPGEYHVDFHVKDRAGKPVYSYPKSLSVAATVTVSQKQQSTLDKWRKDKEEIIGSQAERMDKAFALLPKFSVVGVWFDAGFYHQHSGNAAGISGPWNPFLRRNFEEEIAYLSKTMGLNLIVLSGGTDEEQAYARATFPNFITSAPKPGDYAVYDEPDTANKPFEKVIAWAEDMKSRGVKTIINFSGHKADDLWTDYVFQFLDRYVPDVVSVSCYPIFYDFDNSDFCAARIKAVAKAARKHKAKIFVMLQGFAQLNSWSFPTPYYWLQMVRAAEDVSADGVIFFLWTSGSDARNFFVGIDAMPQDYHYFLRSLVFKPSADVSPQRHEDTKK